MQPTISPQRVLRRSNAYARHAGHKQHASALVQRAQKIQTIPGARIDLVEFIDFRKSQISADAIGNATESYLSLFKTLPPSLEIPDFFAGMLYRELIANEIKHEHQLSDEWHMQLRVTSAIAEIMASNRHLGISVPWQYTLDRFLVLIQDLKTLLGLSWRPRQVCFDFKRPTRLAARCVDAYEDLFSCRIVFGAGINALHFDAAVLGQVVALPSSGPTQFNRIHLNTAQRSLYDPFIEKLARVVRNHSASSTLSLEELCSQLHLSKRTLQQRLRRSGINYRELTDHIAMLRYQAIEKSGAGLAEIAQRLGYSEPSALHRARRRWRHASPASIFASFPALEF